MHEVRLISARTAVLIEVLTLVLTLIHTAVLAKVLMLVYTGLLEMSMSRYVKGWPIFFSWYLQC